MVFSCDICNNLKMALVPLLLLGLVGGTWFGVGWGLTEGSIFGASTLVASFLVGFLFFTRDTPLRAQIETEEPASSFLESSAPDFWQRMRWAQKNQDYGTFSDDGGDEDEVDSLSQSTHFSSRNWKPTEFRLLLVCTITTLLALTVLSLSLFAIFVNNNNDYFIQNWYQWHCNKTSGFEFNPMGFVWWSGNKYGLIGPVLSTIELRKLCLNNLEISNVSCCVGYLSSFTPDVPLPWLGSIGTGFSTIFWGLLMLIVWMRLSTRRVCCQCHPYGSLVLSLLLTTSAVCTAIAFVVFVVLHAEGPPECMRNEVCEYNPGGISSGGMFQLVVVVITLVSVVVFWIFKLKYGNYIYH